MRLIPLATAGLALAAAGISSCSDQQNATTAPDLITANHVRQQGRMTGGGSVLLPDAITTQGGLVAAALLPGQIKITKGFTIHCDITLSNNLEINWPGHKWHIDKPLTAAKCVDDPTVNPVPPAAPFDTFIGDGIGQLDGVDGSIVHFKFIDAGEPGTSDKVLIKVFAPGGGLVLHVPLTLISGGNIQAHFDQPHDK
jgi:hypothetical protein